MHWAWRRFVRNHRRGHTRSSLCRFRALSPSRDLGWSCQRPGGRALERDEAAVRRRPRLVEAFWKQAELW
ncbi:MAG TPA: hypothetical protein PLU30_00790 [Verrucomicrobiae bacterium]|nr:hypothetical protein [Verrucomicrobiae bacterium]